MFNVTDFKILVQSGTGRHVFRFHSFTLIEMQDGSLNLNFAHTNRFSLGGAVYIN
jgi:hypothetical protein